MLSEFLLSLQANSGFAHMAMEASCTRAAPGAAAAVAHSVPRSLARRTTHAAGAGTAKSAAGRRTVVHRRKRRDDLAGPCNHCGALTSPQWRKGPKGKPVLCNACGIRFLRNRTLTKVMVGATPCTPLGAASSIGRCTDQVCKCRLMSGVGTFCLSMLTRACPMLSIAAFAA
jgi:hypothetical protein